MVSNTNGVFNSAPIDIVGEGKIERPGSKFLQRQEFVEKFEDTNTFGFGKLSSPSLGQQDDASAAIANKESKVAGAIDNNTRASTIVGLASSGLNILNAQIDFVQTSEKAKTNIMLAEFQQQEILSIGRANAFAEESKGFAKGEEALLDVAARGQDVSGGIGQSAQRQEELFGVFNAMIIETNAIRKSFGLEKQQAILESQIDIAEINRDTAIASSAISAGVSLAGGFI